jgi:hypothetical protein
MASVYLTYYANVYQKETGMEPTPEVLVRIFNGGPTGYKKSSTIEYANKFAKAYNSKKVLVSK